MMDIKWRILFGKTLIWIVVEIMLNLVGMDDVADYSEFIFDRDTIVNGQLIIDNGQLAIL